MLYSVSRSEETQIIWGTFTWIDPTYQGEKTCYAKSQEKNVSDVSFEGIEESEECCPTKLKMLHQ